MYYKAKCKFRSLSSISPSSRPDLAKKEDNPEEALKEFQVIVEQEEDKGDWYVRRSGVGLE